MSAGNRFHRQNKFIHLLFLFMVKHVFSCSRITVAAVLTLSAKTSETGSGIVPAILDTKEMVYSVQGLSVELVSIKIYFT